MASAHIYKDSVKQRGAVPRCSLLLVPSNQQATLLSSEGYLNRHGVGCITLANIGDATKVTAVLLGWLNVTAN